MRPLTCQFGYLLLLAQPSVNYFTYLQWCYWPAYSVGGQTSNGRLRRRCRLSSSVTRLFVVFFANVLQRCTPRGSGSS